MGQVDLVPVAVRLAQVAVQAVHRLQIPVIQSQVSIVNHYH